MGVLDELLLIAAGGLDGWGSLILLSAGREGDNTDDGAEGGHGELHIAGIVSPQIPPFHSPIQTPSVHRN